MIITNKYNLPQPVVDLLSKNRYDGGESDYSVTTLLNPPRIVQLERRYKDRLTEDVMDKVWSVLGTGVHDLLEGMADESSIIEERFYTEINGRKIGGQNDYYKDGLLLDYKVTSAWSVIFGDIFEKWEQQTNIYKYLMSLHGIKVEHISICAFFRDFDKHKAMQQKGYPKNPCVVYDMEVWDNYKTLLFLRTIAEQHIECEDLLDDDLPPCTPKDMWEQPTKWAVMKGKNKKATRVLDTQEEAEEYISNSVDKDILHITERKGKRTRCEGYCKVKDYCNIYKEYINNDK